MPYIHRKVGNKQCVYKKEDGSKVGCTSGSLEKYLGALHANANENTNKLKGGKADNLSLQDIANKFSVSIDKIKHELSLGIKIEHEHTKDKDKATEIAMDHLTELPDYYTRLISMEKNAEKTLNEDNKNLIKRLLRDYLF